MICIDFQGGTHGNYLEFVCNKFLANIKTTSDTPFNEYGASHHKVYLEECKFKNSHYHDYRGVRTVPDFGDIISIRLTDSDLLPAQAIAFLRAGDYNIDAEQLETNSVNKLNNVDYCALLENITKSFYETQIRDSYNAVKDPQWPDVNDYTDFLNLPQWIQDECKNDHGLYLLDSSSGNFPRWVLREFFKLGFLFPEKNGFILKQQSLMTYNSSNRVYNFPFASFYDLDKFAEQIAAVGNWTNMPFTMSAEFVKLHNEFLTRQPYKNIKNETDSIIEKIKNFDDFIIPSVNLLQESYICAMLEKHYQKEWPTGPISWFSTSTEINKYMQL